MKTFQKNQIESIIKRNYFEVFKLFFYILIMKNPLIYIPFYPRFKNHFSLFSLYLPKYNLNCLGFQIADFIYFDFFRSFSGIGLFISINCFRYYLKKHIFFNPFFSLRSFKSLYLYKTLSNKNGFITWSLIDSIGKWFFRLILCLLIAFIFSFKDIDLEFLSYQNFLNDMVYINNLLEGIFTR